ncbi:ATP-dependent DNA helicase [Corynebacterium sp. p3-SID1056]|uniref:ATP-dependent DNA helicase n=1 Tax=Corynebacterium sp. p3-SID1056 TaxID=2916092 RepID=UPI0021A6DE85|nr:ATP-dependent DNA helicase [Corynebacterium sp. p3-SID1056]MCT2338406.1 ATP-dependent helicase [Corynebacterium sp. p3-SID1056]
MNAPQIPFTPRAYLVPRTRETSARTWPTALPDAGLWKVVGEAGAGVTSFLVDTAVAAAGRAAKNGEDASGIVVLASSKEAAARMRAEISDRLAASGFVSSAPLVRSVHSLAFAVLRQRYEQEIRLISGAEQDAVIRELLRGQVEDGRGNWPVELRPAMGMVGFARQLRDVLLRAVERGLDPAQLAALGKRHGVEIWSAAAEFLHEYQQVMALTGGKRFSASELVSEVLRGEIPAQWHTVIVDDAQHLAPAPAAFIRRLLECAELGVVGGDEAQSIYHFRGASPRFFRDLGGLAHDVIDLGESRRQPRRTVAIAQDEATQLSAVCDALRRAHLEEDVAYRDMAVVVRSTSLIEPVRRSLLQAGVPVMLNPTDVVLSEQRIVAALLLGMRALHEALSPAQWRDLLLGPVGGTDPVTLRRLLRGLRRWAPDARAEETLQALLVSTQELPDFGSVLTDRERGLLERVRAVLDAGRQAERDGGSVEDVLWAVWHATGLSEHLLAVALRGGASGSQADRDLDAAMALFDAAGDFTERRAAAGVESFIAEISAQELPTGVRDRRAATPDAVALLTAHGVAGQEFARVVVAGVQENSWPSLGETGSLFRQEDLVDLIDNGVDPKVPVSHTAERLAEERRLFWVAVTRARDAVLVTTVDDQDGDELIVPSRFIQEYCEDFGIEPDTVVAPPGETTRSGADDDEHVRVRLLARDEVIAELRRALVAETSDEATRNQAARQLARLSEAGVAGAAPEQWWGTTGASISEPLRHATTLSPSRIEGLLACPMRETLGRMVGLEENLAMIYGSMAHAYLEAIGAGMDAEDALAATAAARRDAAYGPGWKTARDVEDFAALLERLSDWVAATRGTFALLGAEVPVRVELDSGVRIAGRLDRLEREESGAVHIVDLKTGATPPTKAATAENMQLAAYQLALAAGTFDGEAVVTARDGETPLRVGGAVLVYPNASKSKLATREQAPKTPDELAELAELLIPLPERTAGPQLLATPGPHCEHCAVRALCPTQPEGQVIYRA